MVHHFFHLLEGLGASILAVGVILGVGVHMTYHRLRFGKGSHKKAA